ncbi:MAG: hypothetical protein ACQESG_06880 [Nanobdellota archaeon]
MAKLNGKSHGLFDLLSCLLPRIDPNIIAGISVLASVLFLLVLEYEVLAFCMLLVILFLDWIGRYIEQKFKRKDTVYSLDVMSDRLSEGIIFVIFFPWFYLFVLNCLLTVYSYRRGTHVILPLRQVFLVYYLIFVVL